MKSLFYLVFRALTGMARSSASLAVENAVLRHQLTVVLRERPRPSFRPADRILWIWVCRHWNQWRSALILIHPATVLRWHRDGYRRHWRRRSGGFGGRPKIPRSHISLIPRISSDHPEWGEDRIALELKTKLGVEHAPNAAAHIECFLGSLKRKCLNHFLLLSDDHLRRTVVAYVAYYNRGRPHQGIDGIPESGPGLPRVVPEGTGEGPVEVVAHPVLGGLHHDYRLAA